MTMLDRMRRHKGWLKWSLALVVLTFIVFYIPDFLGRNQATTLGAAPREVIAAVDGHDLTAGDFQARYQSQIQAYQQQYRQQAPGVAPTSPSTGPMEQQGSQQTLSAQQIAALSDAEYARLRPQLLRSAGNSFRANQG